MYRIYSNTIFGSIDPLFYLLTKEQAISKHSLIIHVQYYFFHGISSQADSLHKREGHPATASSTVRKINSSPMISIAFDLSNFFITSLQGLANPSYIYIDQKIVQQLVIITTTTTKSVFKYKINSLFNYLETLFL